MKKLLITLLFSSLIFSTHEQQKNTATIKHPLSDTDFEYIFKKYEKDLSAANSKFLHTFLVQRYVLTHKHPEVENLFLDQLIQDYIDRQKQLPPEQLSMSAFALCTKTLETYQAMAELQNKPISDDQRTLLVPPSNFLALTSFVPRNHIPPIQRATRSRWIRFLICRLATR